MSKDVYDKLAKESVSELTITHLDASTSSSAVDRTNIAYWGGPITLNRVIEASRTYPHGMAIPNESGIESLTIADAGAGSFKPIGSTVIDIVSIVSNEIVSVHLYDSTTSSLVVTLQANTPHVFNPKLVITPSLYLLFSNGSGSEATVTIPYHKVGL